MKTCELCGLPIPVERLAAVPGAKLCVQCKTRLERKIRLPLYVPNKGPACNLCGLPIPAERLAAVSGTELCLQCEAWAQREDLRSQCEDVKQLEEAEPLPNQIRARGLSRILGAVLVVFGVLLSVFAAVLFILLPDNRRGGWRRSKQSRRRARK